MVIIVGNQKGGAGKSTLSMLLSNYLTMVKGNEVTLLDMDYQKSIYQLYEKAKILENEEPYEVVEAELQYFPSIFKVLSQKKDKIILIDLPGKLDDDGLIPVFQGADLVLVPFTYDAMTYHSTIIFCLVVRKINPRAKLVFIPMRIKSSVKYETKMDVDQEFGRLGTIAEAIPERIDFSRVTTYNTPLSLYNAITPIFETIIKDYINTALEGKAKDE
ncbi:ParA family protein [bacterium]|nr:MAG: ParA family protein [bacterium]